MKKLFLMSVFLLLSFSFFSCNNDDDNVERASLVSKWQPYKLTQSAVLSTGSVSNTTDFNDCQQRSRVTFNSDKSGNSTLYGYENRNCLIQADSNFKYSYNPDNNELVVRNPDGSTQTGTVQSLTATDLVYKLVGVYDYEGEENVEVTTIISARKVTN